MKIVKALFSSIFTLVLIIVILSFVFILSFSKFLSVDFMTQTIKSIDINSLFVDEQGNETEIGQQVYKSFNEFGISKESANELLADEEVKSVLGEFVSSLALSQIDSSVEVVIPSKEKVNQLVNNKIDLFASALNIDLSKASSDDINSTIDQYYDKFVKQLNDIMKGEK